MLCTAYREICKAESSGSLDPPNGIFFKLPRTLPSALENYATVFTDVTRLLQGCVKQ